MACRRLRPAEEINNQVHNYARKSLKKQANNLGKAVQDLQEKLEAYFLQAEVERASRLLPPIVACVVDSNQGYGATFGYMRCWCTKEKIVGMDEKGKSTLTGSNVASFMLRLLDEGIWCECLGEFEAPNLLFDVKVYGSLGCY